jgi:hypothetical protein
VNCTDVIDLHYLSAANGWSNFNWRAGFEVIAAANGEAEIRMKWNDKFTQYAVFTQAWLRRCLRRPADLPPPPSPVPLRHRISR